MNVNDTLVALLPSLRLFVATGNREQDHLWRKAYTAASDVFGEARGLALAHRLQKALWAVMRARPVPLLVEIDPYDTSLTNDEVLFLELISAMCEEHTSRAQDILAMLTYGTVDADAIRNGLSLAALVGGVPSSQKKRPILRVV
ncbi:MAG: hypothetical protein AAGF88_07370 [Pseudomonadota bacterium]